MAKIGIGAIKTPGMPKSSGGSNRTRKIQHGLPELRKRKGKRIASASKPGHSK